MKKLFYVVICMCMITLASSLCESSNVFASNEVEAVMAAEDSYNFVGSFKFYFGRFTEYYDVYEATNACGLYYAKVNSRYYKLFPCNENGCNFYFSDQGVKHFVKI